MKTKLILTAVLALMLPACNTTTTTTTTSKDGKSVTVVVKREASEGVITTVANTLLGGFLSAFQSPAK